MLEWKDWLIVGVWVSVEKLVDDAGVSVYGKDINLWVGVNDEGIIEDLHFDDLIIAFIVTY